MANTTKSDPNDGTETLSDFDQMMSQVVVDLHIARRSFLIYPVTHVQVQRSLDRVYAGLERILSQQPEVALLVMKDGLAAGDHPLPAGHSVSRDLATVLKQYQIVALVFSKGLEKDELVRFLQLVVTDRQTILQQGGMDQAVGRSRLAHIRIQTVDYTQLYVTEEEKIDRSSSADRPAGSIWQQFVAQLAVVDGQDGKGIPSSASVAMDPGTLAMMLNENKVDMAAALNQYEAVYTAARRTAEQPAALAEGLSQFQQMIKTLAPSLQDQFLSSTFSQCGPTATMADTAQLVDGLGGDLVLRMLNQACDQEEAISPSLMAFVKKMAHLEMSPSGSTATGHPMVEPNAFEADEVDTLLAHEQYDRYVDKGYSKLLKKIAAQSQKGVSAGSISHLQHELEESLNATHFTSRAGRAIMTLMKDSTDIAGYRYWARQITYLLDELLEGHAFVFLFHAINDFTKEKKSKDPEKAKIAGLVLDRFADPQFVAKALKAILDFGDRVPQEAMDFVAALGEPVVVEIFEGLDPDDTFLANDSIEIKLLDRLGSHTTREALERLDDPRPEYVRRMIRIIRRMGDDQSAEQVRPLLQHVDKDIRLEALATLLAFDNKWGFIHLRDILADPLAPDFLGAVELAGRYKVAEALPQLIAYAQRSGGDRKRQEAALRALGRIGDPQVIPALNKLVNRRWSLSKKQKDRIKRVVFETLDGYPHDTVKELLHCGLKQKDAAIKACCERVLRKQIKK